MWIDGTPPYIHKLGARWKGQFHSPASTDQKEAAAQSQTRYSDQNKNLFSMPEIEPQSLYNPAHGFIISVQLNYLGSNSLFTNA
jgi:hypothetical protein